jgi:hypothetical protein
MSTQIYQIQISLLHITPKIWRRVLIPSDFPIADLHRVIQTVMGWENGHLHQFIKDRKFYSIRMADDCYWNEVKNTDYKKLKLNADYFFTNIKDKLQYEYDFGDGWLHELMLEKILPIDPAIKYPVCIKGKNNCPPEDCGGPWGYMSLVEATKNKRSKAYREYKEWLGGDFDPEAFDLDEINELLQEKDYGCPDWF